MKGVEPLEFPYRREFSRAGEVVYRPVARFSLRGRNGEWRTFRAYVDSGADISLLGRSGCELLGYSLRRGTPLRIGGVGGGVLRLYVHRLPVKIGTVSFEADVGFSEKDDVPHLLGRRDVFRHFVVSFRERERLTVFVPLR